MAAITIKELCETVFHRIARSTSQEIASLFIFQIESWIPQACQDLAELALDAKSSVSEYLTKTYTITPAAGLFSLTPSTDLMYESLKRATLTHADSDFPLVYLPDPQDLYYPQPNVFIYYALDRSTGARVIRTQDTNGDLDTLTTNLTIRNAIFVPVIGATAGATTLPEQLNNDLVELLVKVALEKAQQIMPSPETLQLPGTPT
jgi:hypothetical protein